MIITVDKNLTFLIIIWNFAKNPLIEPCDVIKKCLISLKEAMFICPNFVSYLGMGSQIMWYAQQSIKIIHKWKIW